jgi:hypothetical protein
MEQSLDSQVVNGARPSRRHLILLAVIAVAVAGTVVFALRSGRRAVHAFDKGPLQTFSSTRTGMLADELGQVFTFGGIVVTNRSKSPVVIEDIRVVPPLEDGMKIVELQVAGPERRVGYVGTEKHFPPADLAPHLRPYRGAAVPPERSPRGEQGMEIVFALRIDRAGSFGFREVHVDYRVGGDRHTVHLEDGFVGCAPRSMFPDGCGPAMRKYFRIPGS